MQPSMRAAHTLAVDGLVAHDVDEPGHRRGALGLEAARGVPDVEEGFLQHLFCALALLHHAPGHAQQVRRCGAVQLLESALVTQRGAGQQLFEIGVGGGAHGAGEAAQSSRACSGRGIPHLAASRAGGGPVSAAVIHKPLGRRSP
jgi:hypothetical protein